MSKKVLVDLAMKLSADSAELRKGMEESRREMQRMRQGSQNVGKDMTVAFAKVTAAVGAAYAGFKAFESTIRSTRAGADALDEELTALKNGIDFLQVSVSTFNFDNIVDGFYNAIAVGREYQTMLDMISDSQRALSWRGSEDDVRLAELRRLIYSEEIQSNERIAAIKESQSIIQERLNDRLRISEMAYDAIYDKIKDTHRLSEEQMQAVVQYLRQFDKLSDIKPLSELLEADKALRDLRSIDEARRANLGTDRTGQPILGPLQLSPETLAQQQQVDQMIMSLDRETLLLWEAIKNNMGSIADAVRDALTQAGVEVNKVKADALNSMAMLDRYLRSATRERGGGGGAGGVGAGAIMPDHPYDWSGIDYGQMGMSWKDRINQFTKQENEVIEPYLDSVLEKFNQVDDGIIEASNAFNMWEGVAVGAAQSVVNAFFDMAQGIEVSIESILRNLLRMIAMQMVQQAVSGLFAGALTGGVGGAAMMGGGAINMSGMSGLGLTPGGMSMGGFKNGPAMGINLYGMIQGENIALSNKRFLTRQNLIE